jgi:hypothetical protein
MLHVLIYANLSLLLETKFKIHKKFQIQTRKILKRKPTIKQDRLEPDEKRRTSTKPNLIFTYLYETTRDHTFSLNVIIFIPKMTISRPDQI